MELTHILLLLYAPVVVWAIWMTYRERRSKGLRNPFHAAAGLLACTIWPLILLALILTSVLRPQDRKTRDSRGAEAARMTARPASGGV